MVGLMEIVVIALVVIVIIGFARVPRRKK